MIKSAPQTYALVVLAVRLCIPRSFANVWSLKGSCPLVQTLAGTGEILLFILECAATIIGCSCAWFIKCFILCFTNNLNQIRKLQSSSLDSKETILATLEEFPISKSVQILLHLNYSSLLHMDCKHLRKPFTLFTIVSNKQHPSLHPSILSNWGFMSASKALTNGWILSSGECLILPLHARLTSNGKGQRSLVRALLMTHCTYTSSTWLPE